MSWFVWVVSACKAKGMMPPAGWTGAGAGAESASPLRLENLGAGRWFPLSVMVGFFGGRIGWLMLECRCRGYAFGRPADSRIRHV